MSACVQGTTRIVRATATCARERGWYGQTIFDNKKVYPFHNQPLCAVQVFSIKEKYATTASDMFDAMGTCFQINQGCAQSISGALKQLFGTLGALVKATMTCAPRGSDPPFFSEDDIPVAGLVCWDEVERILKGILLAARFIDSAIDSCPDDPGSYGLPRPLQAARVAEAGVAANATMSPEEELGDAPNSTTAPDATKAFLRNIMDRSKAAAWSGATASLSMGFYNSQPALE